MQGSLVRRPRGQSRPPESDRDHLRRGARYQKRTTAQGLVAGPTLSSYPEIVLGRGDGGVVEQGHDHADGSVMTALGGESLVVVARYRAAQGMDALVPGRQADAAETGLRDAMQLRCWAVWNVGRWRVTP